jgi:threonine aldolase
VSSGAERVNLHSDTQTRPTPGMRKAIAQAEVGDEQRGLDPTVNALQGRVAELLGHEAALFLPSGTMCNQIGIRLHTRPGDQIVLERFSHPVIAEGGGPAAHAGVMVQAIDGEGGRFTANQVAEAVARPTPERYSPRPRLLCVEQTTNYGGGRVWSLEALQDVLRAAGEHDLRTHLDGARLMNAVVAAGVPASAYASGFTTAWMDFTKGLGAPIGACLAGPQELIEEAWRYKQMMGGALRQAGIAAAAGLYALDHHVDRLAEDHANARALADGLAELPGIELDPTEVQTNIVVFGVQDAEGLCAALERAGVKMSALDATRVRAVTHLDVDRADVDTAIAAARAVLVPQTA